MLRKFIKDGFDLRIIQQGRVLQGKDHFSRRNSATSLFQSFNNPDRYDSIASLTNKKKGREALRSFF